MHYSIARSELVVIVKVELIIIDPELVNGS